MTADLPRPNHGMTLDEALFLELYHILIDAQIITENEALKKYKGHGWGLNL